MDPKDRKKIQFSVPAPPSQLDPRQVEMVRGAAPHPHITPAHLPDATPSPAQSGQSHVGPSLGCSGAPHRTGSSLETPSNFSPDL